MSTIRKSKSVILFSVFTSTVNVAFSGDEILGGTEASHKWRVTHCDVYSRYRLG
jgi:hypothetical protein